MSLFNLFKKNGSPRESQVNARPAIEPLEGRAYMSGIPNLTLTVPGPIPTSAVAGFVVNDKIGINIANNGTAPARGRVTVLLYASPDGNLSDASQIAQRPTQLGIAIGRNKTYKINVHAFPVNLDNNYVIIAQVIGLGALNATGTSVAAITVRPQEVDLADSVLKLSANGRVGRKIDVILTVVNNGNVIARPVFDVAFGASTLPDGSNPFPLGTLVKRLAIKPGHFAKIHFRVPLMIGMPTGNQYIVATVDPLLVFPDPNRLDNTTVSLSPVSVF